MSNRTVCHCGLTPTVSLRDIENDRKSTIITLRKCLTQPLGLTVSVLTSPICLVTVNRVTCKYIITVIACKVVKYCVSNRTLTRELFASLGENWSFRLICSLALSTKTDSCNVIWHREAQVFLFVRLHSYSSERQQVVLSTLCHDLLTCLFLRTCHLRE